MQINILCAKLILVSVIAVRKKLKNKEKLDIVKISVSNNVCVIITDLIPYVHFKNFELNSYSEPRFGFESHASKIK